MIFVFPCGQDNASACFFHRNGDFYRRRGTQAEVDHRYPHCTQRIDYQCAYDLAGNATVPPYHDLVATRGFDDPVSKCSSTLHNVLRGQVFTGAAADGAAKAGNRFNEWQF